MPNKITRRSFMKGTLKGLLGLFASGSAGYYYAHNIEPHSLKITHHTISHKKIPKGFSNFKMIQFSDTHIGFQYDLTQFEQLVNEINALNPDIIFFTGDLLDNPNKFNEHNHVISLLQRLKAPFGKFAVYGNHDHGGYGSTIYKNIMEQSGFQILLNRSQSINILDGSKIQIAGIDDAMLGKPSIETSILNVSKDDFTILLSHAPDYADEAALHEQFHLQLSGHSHGGQVQIPFFGALVTPPFAEKYIEGFYEIGNHAPLLLYVNRGVGTTRIPFRFLAKPELTVFTLKPL